MNQAQLKNGKWVEVEERILAGKATAGRTRHQVPRAERHSLGRAETIYVRGNQQNEAVEIIGNIYENPELLSAK